VLVVDADRRRGSALVERVAAQSDAEHLQTVEEALVRVGELSSLKALVIERDLPDGIDGFEAVALLSEWHAIDDVTTIVVAATEDERAVKRSIESSCDAYIVEPDPVARADLAALAVALLTTPAAPCARTSYVSTSSRSNPLQ